MPETKQIATLTTVSLVGNALSIFTEFDPEIPELFAFISPVDQFVNGTKFRMGDLGIHIDDRLTPDDIDFSLDVDGNLIADGNLAAQFSINSNGELIFTYT